jgi:2-phosphosulfolactate phosphatase
MKSELEVLFTPADFSTLPGRDLGGTVCVVFDVLRATSSMIAALDHGARRIRPVATIDEALAQRRAEPDVLLAGERNGLRIAAELAGGVEFDFGNSPREFTAERVASRSIVMTTTNGTRALAACAGARAVLVAGFLNLDAVARWLLRERPGKLNLVCSGTYDEAAYEDTLAAGALCDRLWSAWADRDRSDSAAIARQVFLAAAGDLRGAAEQARNARRLLTIPELRDDVSFCLQRDTIVLVPQLRAGGVEPW